MPPHYENETSILQKYDEDITTNNNVALKQKDQQSIYDRLLPRNENKLLTFLRSWEKRVGFVTPIIWKNLVFTSLLHVISLVWFAYNLSQCYLPKWQTVAFYFLVGNMGGFGVTGGVHRLFTHRSYKAKLPLKVFLLFCYTIAGQNSVYNWVRDHRVHHKHSETDADPHDSRRGLFFSHMGWLMMKKHPKVLEEGAKIDMSDITGDPVLRFHDKYFSLFQTIVVFILPVLVAAYGWNETWGYSILSQPFLRYITILNYTWAVNSFAHFYGNKPYDKNIQPRENVIVAFVSMGEGWHNYHHTFPWDYRAAELPYKINLTTILLDMFSKIGWVYDAKVASPALIKATALRKDTSKQSGLTNGNVDESRAMYSLSET